MMRTMRNRDKESVEQSKRGVFFFLRDCLAVHFRLGQLVVNFDAHILGHVLTIMLATPKWSNYLPAVVVGPVVATAGVVEAVVVVGVPAAVFSGGAVPGKAELCPGIEYCGRN
jgi:hypothetical protein